ncbi:MAG TPA: glycoside hydrolase family 172 protein [bacterium]|nr:glycoside hydrolase family 172 protein [bacterium]
MKKAACLVISLSLGVLFFSLSALGQEQEVTLSGLVGQMRSLKSLSRAFPAGTRLVQFSSYDRRTTIKDGATVMWWANGDLGHFLREEQTERGTEYVMAEATGPGAIVRLWSANPWGVTWRIYIDGMARPVIEANGSDLLSGKVEPWGDPFAGRRNTGYNLYFPIPFSKSVKVTAAKSGGKGGKPPLMYYQVDVRLYRDGTRVQPFSWDAVNALGDQIAAAARALSAPGLNALPDGEKHEVEAELAPGARGELFRLAGPREIVMFQVELTGDERYLDAVLGQTLLTMQWDGMAQAQALAPLGDFFGTSPGANGMSSLPALIERTEHGARLLSRWVMPFREEAVLSLLNESGERLKLRAAVVTAPCEWDDDTLYFHAAYREKNGIRTRPFSDMRMLEAHGRGHFVGLEMNVRNPMEYFWWGEGDEKVWVDQDQFPSIFGTGTEDYFGYAWCVQYFKFTHAYHGVSLPTREWLAAPQVLTVPWLWEAVSNATGRAAIVSQYRWQILDAIPFESGLRFDMEIYHHRDTTIDVNATAFWYAAPGGGDDATEPDLAAREVWKR